MARMPASRGIAARLTQSPAAIGLCSAALAALVGVAYAKAGPGPAFALVLVPVVIYFILAQPGNGLALAGFTIMVVPYWYAIGTSQATVPRLTAALAGVGLVVGYRRGLKLTLPDMGVLGLAALAIVSYHSGLHIPHGLLYEFLASLSLYLFARLTPPGTVRKAVWGLAVGGFVGAVSVIYEYVALKAPLVADQSQYGWYQTKDYIYRPGGLFGSPPAAAGGLAIGLLCAIGLRRGATGIWRRFLDFAIGIGVLALFLTFTRAGWVGFGLGLVLYFIFTVTDANVRRRLVIGGAIAAVLFLVVLPTVSGSDWFKLGVLRGGTLVAREDYWRLALPVSVDSPTHFIFGRGFLAVLSARSGGNVDPGLAAAPLLGELGAHNQFVLTLVEEGLIGLALMLTWLLGSVVLPIKRLARLDRDARPLLGGLVGAVVSFGALSLANDSLRDAQTTALGMLVAGLAVSIAANARPRRADV